MKVVNLSSRPFLNSRPLVRLATALWVVGGLLFAGNLWSYGSHAAKFAESQHQLEEIDAQIQHNQGEIRRLDRELSTLALTEQNEQVAFLNTLIARRAFPWSLLFEQLEGILPEDVRLLQVRPEIQLAALPGVRQTRTTDSDRTRRTRRETSKRKAPETDQVQLQLVGTARSDDPLLDFVDALFASPYFDKPVLHQENRETTGDIRFQLDVLYLLAPPETETGAPGLVLGAAEGDQPAAETEVSAEDQLVGTGGAAGTRAAPSTAVPPGTVDAPRSPSTLGARAGEVAPPQAAAPTLRQVPGAAPPSDQIASAEPSAEVAPGQRRTLQPGTTTRTTPGAAPPAGVVFGTPVPPAATPEPVGTGTPNIPNPLTRQRPTLERPRLGPPPANLAPVASASPRLRRGGRP